MPEESNNQHSDSSPFGSDEFPVDDLAFGDALPESDAQPPVSGNRPADGARQVSPDEVLSTGFDGSENAGDFLGLDLEFTGAMTDAAPELDVAPPLATDTQPAPAPEADYDAEFDLDGPTQIMHADEDADYEGYEDEYDEEFAEGDEFEGELDAELEVEPGGRGKLVAIALGVGALAFAGVKFGPQFLNKDTTAPPTNVASNTRPAPDAADTAPDATGAAGAAAIDPTVESGTDPVAAATTDPSAIDLGTDPDTTTPDAFDAASDALAAAMQGATDGDGTVDSSGFDASPIDVLLNGDETGDAPGAIDPNVAASVGMSADPETFPEFEAGYEWISPDLLDMVWRGSSVPMEAISAPSRTLMPRVGHVRVHMLSGETIDGRLYAVGQKRVWIDVEPGRIGLDGESVESFEHLAIPSDVEGGAVETTPVPISGRVSVEAPGGLIYGRILTRGENTVTLVCDDGSKVTLHDGTVQPVTENRAILVQR